MVTMDKRTAFDDPREDTQTANASLAVTISNSKEERKKKVLVFTVGTLSSSSFCISTVTSLSDTLVVHHFKHPSQSSCRLQSVIRLFRTTETLEFPVAISIYLS